jgi:radical SAM enzyme (TIGR01210 family)
MSTTSLAIYPENGAARDRWILDHRQQRNQLDPSRPYGFFVEEERAASGELVSVATILLTNRECPWRCLMCDLWKNTLPETVPAGAIPAQIEFALKQLPPARQIKLYNSGSFFDRRAIPAEDHPQIAQLVQNFDRVIVECHPALIGEDCFRFNDLIKGTLEVAMGLETAHPQILEKLNKRMTLEQFSAAAERLRSYEIPLRVFVLVKPPFMEEPEALEWAIKSVDFALNCGATAVSPIPTRSGNGAIDELAKIGSFSPPSIYTLESAVEYGLTRGRGRVFADLWDTSQLLGCTTCFQDRVERLRRMNLEQRILQPVSCEDCGGALDG